MSDQQNDLPLNVRRQLERSNLELSQLESQAEREKQLRLSKAETSNVATTRLQNPQPIPEEQNEETFGGSTAMQYLMKDKSYIASVEEEMLRQKANRVEQSILEQTLNGFFMGKVPPLEKKTFADNPREWADSVLQKYAVPPRPVKKSSSGAQGASAPLNASGPLGASKAASGVPMNASMAMVQKTETNASQLQHQYAKQAKVQPRTLFKSIKIFQELLERPLSPSASVFEVAFRTFKAADFLLGDLQEALQKDDKEVSKALFTAREAYLRSFSDQKAGEFLVAAELSRLRQELYLSERLREELHKKAIETCLGLEQRRQVQEEGYKKTLQEVEERRRTEVKQVIAKSKEYGEQVKTLKNLVDIIRADQQVQQIDKLKRALREKEQIIKDFQAKLEESNSTIAVLKTQIQAQENETKTLKDEAAHSRHQLKIAEAQKEFCKACGNKLTQKARSLGLDMQQRLERVQAAAAEIEGPPPEDSQLLLNRLRASQDDEVLFGVDFTTVSKDLLVLESKLKALRETRFFEEALREKDTEIQRLQNVESELQQLRKAYKAVIAKAQSQQSDSQNTCPQGTGEGRTQLVRQQQLYQMLGKTFNIELVQASVPEITLKAPMNCTVEYAASVFWQFFLQLAQSCLLMQKNYTSLLQPKLTPGGAPLQSTEPPLALLTGYITNGVPSQYEAEVLLNKLTVVLSQFALGEERVTSLDQAGVLALSQAVFNGPITADEFQLVLYILILSRGGVRLDEMKVIGQLSPQVGPAKEFLTMQRAGYIAQLVLNKQTQKSFFERLVSEGRAQGTVVDVQTGQQLDGVLYDCPLAKNPPGEELKIQSAVLVNYFVLCVLRAYRGEQLLRLESLRLMYAGQLIEEASLQRSSNITDSQRYRIVTEVIRCVSPQAQSTLIDAAYLDTIWRSPQAIWPSLVDSCRVRGVFAAALELPPLGAALRLCGGYKNDTIDWDTLCTQNVGRAFRAVQILRAFCLQLQGLQNAQLQALLQRALEIDPADIDATNSTQVLDATRVLQQELIELCASITLASGQDLSACSPPNEKTFPYKLSKLRRTPDEALSQVVDFQMVTLAAICGWDLGETRGLDLLRGRDSKDKKSDTEKKKRK